MAGTHIPGEKLNIEGKSPEFPYSSVSTLSVLQRELTEELENAIACMTDQHFPSSEKRKDNLWPGQVEKRAVAGAGAAWERGQRQGPEPSPV